MNHIVKTACATLAMSLAAPSALAAYGKQGIEYSALNPDNGSVIIALSGECAGKVVKPVTKVTYFAEYTQLDGAVIRDGVSTEFSFQAEDDIETTLISADYLAAGDKVTQSVKGEQLSLSINSKNRVHTSFWQLASGDYDSQIRCKSGKTLSETLQGYDPGINGDTDKTASSLKHTHRVSNPAVGTFQAKSTTTGVLEQKSLCTHSGQLFGETYQLTCVQAKPIKVKVVAMASGESLSDN